MPIKDITPEEKSNLYMVGKKPKESTKISENERGKKMKYNINENTDLSNKIFFLATFNTVLPLAYYDILSDQISKKDDNLAEYTSAANNFFNNEVQNPNTYNKHNSYTLTMVTRLPQADQDFINEVITNNVEKLQWDPVEIARHLKVKTGTFAHNENNKLKYYLLVRLLHFLR